MLWAKRIKLGMWLVAGMSCAAMLAFVGELFCAWYGYTPSDSDIPSWGLLIIVAIPSVVLLAGVGARVGLVGFEGKLTRGGWWRRWIVGLLAVASSLFSMAGLVVAYLLVYYQWPGWSLGFLVVGLVSENIYIVLVVLRHFLADGAGSAAKPGFEAILKSDGQGGGKY